MEEGGWKMEDGGWRMEDGGWRTYLQRGVTAGDRAARYSLLKTYVTAAVS